MAETRDLGDEMHQLLNAVQDWVRRVPDPRDGTHDGGECLAWCPICQFANLLRGEYPEVTERLAEAATAIASAMKALADVAISRAQSDAARRAKPAHPGPRVEHIRIDDPAES